MLGTQHDPLIMVPMLNVMMLCHDRLADKHLSAPMGIIEHDSVNRGL